MMLKSSREARVLARVTEDARREQLPFEMDPRLEDRLIEAIRRSPPIQRETRRRARVAWMLAPVAAAAVAAGLAVWPNAPVLVPNVAVQAGAERIDGDAVEKDVVLRAESEALEVHHDSRADWTLEAGSTARILRAGERIRVELLSGSLRAKVTPSDAPERFVVETRTTRVSVHGTVFRVALESARTLVQVEEGVVEVSSRAKPDEGVLLTAPSAAHFGADGLPELHAASRPRAERTPSVRRTHSAPPQSAAPASASAAPRELTIGEVEAGVATVVQAVTRCFEAHTTGAGDVTIRARTVVTLDVAPDGSIMDVSFGPPLAPAVHACAERDARAARFAAGELPTRITRVLELSR